MMSLSAPAPASAPPSAFAAPPAPPSERTVDVCVTHKTADFDSFAAAVGMARLRGKDTKILIPAGEAPQLARYLSLHRGLFPIADIKAIDVDRLRWMGVVDLHQRKRMGPAAEFLVEGVEVEVVDHHQHGVENCDIPGAYTQHTVGAVTTAIVERLRGRPDILLTQAEATIMAIAIHTDTGNLTYENTTSRDVQALAWLLERGACQRSISTFARDYLSPEQQRLLTVALDSMTLEEVNGFSVASCLVESSEFVKGCSAVAQVGMELSNVDVFLFAVMTPASRKARRAAVAAAATGGDSAPAAAADQVSPVRQVSIIGRARSRVEGVDFSALFTPLGGGGHAKAASASVKVSSPAEAQDCVEDLVRGISFMLPEPVKVGAFMSRNVACVSVSDTMRMARGVLFDRGHTGLAVVTAEAPGAGEAPDLVGVISRQDIALAERKGLLDSKVKGWIARKVVAITEDTPLFEAEKMLAEHKIGRLPVVKDGKAVGIVTRSDVLRQRRFLSQ
jgi:tRNA nucleotidyltransferase (CCA-adding enzyme)